MLQLSHKEFKTVLNKDLKANKKTLNLEMSIQTVRDSGKQKNLKQFAYKFKQTKQKNP
jgi:hypothetical protein